jgi:hypothetical protein
MEERSESAEVRNTFKAFFSSIFGKLFAPILKRSKKRQEEKKGAFLYPLW